jgi:hypothetical protein
MPEFLSPGFADDEAVAVLLAAAPVAAVPYRPEQLFSDWGA